jgi:signal transduction histidine kinase
LTASIGSFALLAVVEGLSAISTPLQFFGILLIFVAVGAVNSTRDALVAWATGIATIAYAVLVLPSSLAWGDFLLTASFCTVMAGAGWLVSHRSRQVHHVRLEAERDLDVERQRASQALAEQRGELARELHDVVSHGLSVVVLQAQAARLEAADISSPSAAEVERRLNAVEVTARDALGEMRRLLGLLELDPANGNHQTSSPSPRVEDLPVLVDRARAVGLAVELELPPDFQELPAGLGLTVYRIVQEALTNAAKHAPGCTVSVRLSSLAGMLEVLVTNSRTGVQAGHGLSGGRGLIGMRERVEMYDGHLEAGPDKANGFRLRVVLPLDAYAERLRDREHP